MFVRSPVKWRQGPLASLLAGGLVMALGPGLGREARAADVASVLFERGGAPPHPPEPPPRLRRSESGSAASVAVSSSPHPREVTRFKRRWGVEPLGVRWTAAGYMLEFRYRVIDAKKARPLFERKTKPMLVDEATMAQLVVPTPGKVGPLRNSDPPLAGRTYWMFFANPGKFVKPGNRVSVVIGDFRAEGIVVQ